MDEVLIRNALNSMLEATKDDATPIIRRLARVQARAALATLASAPAGPLPDIGPDPFKGPREDDRYEGSRLRLRAAYVQQQKGVPDQTALVWRYDLGTMLEMAIRLKSILADDEEPASAPAGDGVEALHQSAAKYAAICDKLADQTPVVGEPDPLWWERQSALREAGVLLAALARPRAAVGERPKPEPQAWGDIECSGCTLPRRDCECN